MPWKETNVMSQRVEFVMKSFNPNVNFSDLCAEYTISTKTGYKWKERFIKEGLPGLKDKSTRPFSHPKKISEDVICELIRIKKMKKNWGPKKIRLVYAQHHEGEYIPSRTSVERILKKAGFVKKKRRQKQYTSERITNRVIPQQSNDVWTVDFKGWWYTPKKDKCEPLTIRDEFSKYIFSIKILDKSTTYCVKQEFERIFSEFGLPKVIKSDNGPPFANSNSMLGLTKLAVWWMSLGIMPDRIDPGAPFQNGSHERMHRDIKDELEGQIDGELKLHQSMFDIWKEEYNTERPHESLSMKTPSEVYQNSERKYKGTTFEILYPSGYIPRKVNNRGIIYYKGKRTFISNAFAGYYVGLQFDKMKFNIWFSNIKIGEIDLKTSIFTPIVSLGYK
jgi:putative transposase